MSFGCCNRFKDCSNLGQCVYEGDVSVERYLDYNECEYKEKIDKGLNFYTEYNENNRKAKVRKKVYSKMYIEIPNRLFLIGKRSPYGAWTYDLDEEDRDALRKELEKHLIYCFDTVDDKKLKDDTASGEERCNSRVVLRLNDKQYNILNYNCRAMKKETTLKIASYLLKKGLIADIEMLTGYSGNKVLKSIDYNKSSRSIREQSKNMIQSDQSKGKQLSFFDNSAVYKLHTNV